MNKRHDSEASGARAGFRSEGGYTIIQIVIALAVIGIVSTFAVMGVVQAREGMRLQNSATELAAHLERTRADSLRRHASAANGLSRIEIPDVDPRNVYNVFMDYNSDGTVAADEFRAVTLQTGVAFTGLAAGTQVIEFDWRGRIGTNRTLNLENSRATYLIISAMGDVTVNGDLYVPSINANPSLSGGSTTPTPTPSPSPSPGASPSPSPGASPSPDPSASPTPEPSATPKPDPSATPTPDPGASPKPTATPTPTPDPTPTPTPTPESTPKPRCQLVVTPAYVEVKINKTSGTVVTAENADGDITVTAEPNGVVAYVGSGANKTNTAVLTLGLVRAFAIDPSGGSVGVTYELKFTSQTCDPASVRVKVLAK